MPISAAEAGQHIASLNMRVRKPVPAFLRDPDRFPSVYIYNIYQRQHEKLLGSLGKWIIPACGEGKPYSAPLIVPGLVIDEYDEADGNGRMSYNEFEGQEVAKDIVGIGSTSHALSTLTTNMEWWGVFIAKGQDPLKRELDLAKEKLTQCMKMWLADGDKLDMLGDQGRVQIGPTHREACNYLNQARAWSAVVVANLSCPGCGTPVSPSVARCAKCNTIVNKEIALRLAKEEAELQQQVAAMKPPVKV